MKELRVPANGYYTPSEFLGAHPEIGEDERHDDPGDVQLSITDDQLDSEEIAALQSIKRQETKPRLSGSTAYLPPSLQYDIASMIEPELKVLIVLAYHRNGKTGIAAPGLDRIESMTGLPRITVRRALDSLRKKHKIRRMGGGYKGTATGWLVFGPRNAPA